MELDDLRSRLAAIDREILALVARRQAAALEIAEAKRRGGLPTRDFDQERQVVERARATAGGLGLPPALAERLLLLLIHSSLTVQERDQVVAAAGGSGRRALIIGGAGRMGRWMARFLDAQGFAVEVADPAGPVPPFPGRAAWEEGPVDHDFVVVATPLRACAGVLRGLAARRPPGIVFDIGSLKGPLRPGLAALAGAGVRVTSIHPMFGPDTELLSGRHVVFVDAGDPAATDEVRGLFASTMAVPMRMDLESHDRLIAYVLGLSHALNIAFFTALAESGETAPRLARASSTTFDAQLEVAGRVAEESPHLYFEIQSLNEYGTESLTALLLAVERLRSIVRSGDEAAFAALMERGRRYLDTRRPGAAGEPGAASEPGAAT